MPHAETAAAPPLVAPRTLRKRLRSIGAGLSSGTACNRGRILRGCHGPAERPLAPADDLVTAEARLHRGDSGLTRHGDRAVTIQAGDLVLAGVDVVTKEDRLTGTGKFPRVGDDASGGGRCGLSVLRRGWAGNEESDSDAGRGPTTPLRHQSRSMANVLFVGGTACGAGM